MLFSRRSTSIPSAEEALPGRAAPTYRVPETHAVLKTSLQGPWPEGMAVAVFGMGCFWGAERIFWQTEGVYSTAAGYAGGSTPNPTYDETCTGRTGHTEAVQVVYDPAAVSFESLLKTFWESHDPTQGMRQGNDLGSQYRSAIYTSTEAQLAAARASRERFQPALSAKGYGEITTEVAPLVHFYPAEDYHQQYLYKVPNGYCGISGTGASCPIGVASTD